MKVSIGGVLGDFRFGSIVSVEQCPWHVGFTPDSGRIAAAQRTGALGEKR